MLKSGQSLACLTSTNKSAFRKIMYEYIHQMELHHFEKQGFHQKIDNIELLSMKYSYEIQYVLAS